jgi:hypothetical protein
MSARIIFWAAGLARRERVPADTPAARALVKEPETGRYGSASNSEGVADGEAD